MSNAAATGDPVHGLLGDVFGPIGRFLGQIFKIILIILIVAIFVLSLIIGGRYLVAKYQTGELSSTVTHTKVAGEETLSPFASVVKSFSPELYGVIYPNTATPGLAFDSVVETNAENSEVGVKITSFKPIIDFFRPNTDIRLLGTIKARGIEKDLTIQAFCSLEDYKKGVMIPAELLGTNTQGNEGTILKDQTTEFTATCTFPKGIGVKKQVTTKEAKLILKYEFLTTAYQRIYLMDKNALYDLQSNSINPFKKYKTSDPLLSSSTNKVTSKTTPGPINLGLQIDFPQPITTGAKYILLTKLSRTGEVGNLESIDSLKIYVPNVEDATLVLEGEKNLGGASTCDFEFVGDTEEGYKEFKLLDAKKEEINKACTDTFAGVPLPESECLSVFKSPLFTCNFIATKVPNTLQSDKIRAEAKYTYVLEKKSTIDIRALPQELEARA